MFDRRLQILHIQVCRSINRSSQVRVCGKRVYAIQYSVWRQSFLWWKGEKTEEQGHYLVLYSVVYGHLPVSLGSLGFWGVFLGAVGL